MGVGTRGRRACTEAKGETRSEQSGLDAARGRIHEGRTRGPTQQDEPGEGARGRVMLRLQDEAGRRGHRETQGDTGRSHRGHRRRSQGGRRSPTAPYPLSAHARREAWRLHTWQPPDRLRLGLRPELRTGLGSGVWLGQRYGWGLG